MTIFTIEQGKLGGAVLMEQADRWDDKTIMFAGSSITDVVRHMDPAYVPAKPRPTADYIATALVDCFEEAYHITRKINMIKTVRNAADCGLREAKEAVEDAIRKRQYNS